MSRNKTFGLVFHLITGVFGASSIFGQGSKQARNLQPEATDGWTIITYVLVGCLGIAVYFWFKTKDARTVSDATRKSESGLSYRPINRNSKSERNLEWLKQNPTGFGSPERSLSSRSTNGSANGNGFSAPHSIAVENIDEVSAVLPIYSFFKVKPTGKFDPLPVSDDLALLSAIEEVREETEEDEEIRALAVRILAAFKTSNSVEALSQVALYDLSSNQRSAAVSTLSQFDHESVFETILLACADPTREVRAAAARGLFHLSFDRAEAWARIANLKENGRMVQMARAAIEADLVERSFERLVHRDRKYAYEAFALVTLLIRAGEMDVVTEFLHKSSEPKLRRAILHTIKVSKNKHGLNGLQSLLKKKNLVPECQEDVDKTIEEMGFVTV